MTEPAAVWYTRCPVPTPLGLAVQLGYVEEAFRRHGVALRSIAESADPAVRESHFTHSLAWSFRQGGNIPPIHARAAGRATRLLGITWSDEFQAIVTLPETGIRGPRDLAGRRFGVPSRTVGGIVDFHRATALKGLVSGLALAGLGVDAALRVDVAIDEPILPPHEDPRLFGLKKRLPYAHEVAALVRGEVDAIYVKGTQGVTVANLFGLHAVAEFGFHPDPKVRINSGTPRVLTVDENLAVRRPDLAAALVAEVVRAGAWAAAHPEEARRFVGREVGASEETVLAANGPDGHLHLGIGLEPPLVEALRHYARFLREWGFIEAELDLDAWIDPGPLAAAADLAKAA